MICLTANAVSGAREWYLDRGFNDYLTKPVTGHDLEEMLVKYLPHEKVSLTGACTFNFESGDSLPEWLLSSSESGHVLDTKTGLKYCGSAADYLEALRLFQKSADQKADEIEQFFKEKDWKNFTTNPKRKPSPRFI